MKLIEFINQNKDWRERLSQPPFCISIKQEGPYYLLKYNQIKSDMSNEIVKQCRGIIIKKELGSSVISGSWCTSDLVEKYKIVCYPFDKFFNYGESNAASIDWSTARVQEKVDGSIIKVWWDDEWKLSTNGTINAFNAQLGDGAIVKSFGDLFMKVIHNHLGNDENETLNDWAERHKFNKEYTFIFELVSPFNRVVVPYDKDRIYMIGLRHNTHYIEGNPYREKEGYFCGFESTEDEWFLPKSYPLNSIEDCLKATKAMGFDEEGFVVVDNNFNRIKIKSPQYVAAHYIANNHVQTIERFLNIILRNEQDEFLTYFPEYTKHIDSIKNILNDLFFNLENLSQLFYCTDLDSQKDFALWVQKYIKKEYQGYCFWARKIGKEKPEDWFNTLTNNKKEELIKLYYSLYLEYEDVCITKYDLVNECIKDYIKTLGTDWEAEWGLAHP